MWRVESWYLVECDSTRILQISTGWRLRTFRIVILPVLSSLAFATLVILFCLHLCRTISKNKTKIDKFLEDNRRTYERVCKSWVVAVVAVKILEFQFKHFFSHRRRGSWWCDVESSISSQFRAGELLKCPASTIFRATREEFWILMSGEEWEDYRRWSVGAQQWYSISHPAIVVII